MKYVIVYFSVLILGVKCPVFSQFSSNTVLHMEKTGCRGECPIYKLTLLKNRSIFYNGIKNVELTGDYYAKVKRKEFRKLISLLENKNIFEFKTKYTADLPDLPTTYLYYGNKDKKIFITDYFGAPAELKEIEKYFADYIEKLTWKKQKTLKTNK